MLCTSPIISDMFRYWKSLDQANGMSKASAIDVLDMPVEHLPRIFLVDVEYGEAEPRYKFRLAGSYMYQMSGFELTGKYVDDLPLGPKHDIVVQEYVDCLASRSYVKATHKFYIEATGKMVSMCRVLLPLTHDGQRVDRVLGVIGEICSKVEQCALEPLDLDGS